MSSRVVLCSGCCCGRVEKGHNEVPVDDLKDAWGEHALDDSVELMISGCLGPCKMHNVSVLVTDGDMLWLGGLGEESHYDALVEWAKEVAHYGPTARLPEILAKKQFEPTNVKEEVLDSISNLLKIERD